MEIVYDRTDLEFYIKSAVEVSPGKPILIDKFLEDATEIDVDAISDGKDTIIGGVMEHIEEAGIHSGDSACILPPISLKKEIIEDIKEQTKAIAKELNVVGLMNIQFAVKDNIVYVLEVNPRASRTVPFVSKSTGVSLAKLATKVIMGKSLRSLGLTQEIVPSHVCVKESVFPFDRFPNVDIVLGPGMRSTGEVMGIDREFGLAFAKAQISAGQKLPLSGTIFMSLKDEDKMASLEIAFSLHDMGFKIVATEGTSSFLSEHGLPNQRVNKLSEGRPNIIDMIKNGDIDLVINTTSNKRAITDAFHIRRAAVAFNVPYTTTLAGARATVKAIKAMRKEGLEVYSLQEYHKEIADKYGLNPSKRKVRDIRSL